MMQEEFEERIGLTVMLDEYEEIEPLYASDPKNRDKDAFCRHWLKEGGLQWLFDRRRRAVALKAERIAELEKELASCEQQIANMNKELAEKNRRIITLKDSMKKVKELVA